MNLENIKGLSTEMIMILSEIIDKMEIGSELKKIEVDKDNETEANKELYKELMVLFISKIYKAQDAVYKLIAKYKNVDIEEAKTLDIIPIIQEIFKVDGLKDFLS